MQVGSGGEVEANRK